ncbi:dienelactone hydrolase family protein [Georgenia sp. TF02-10]|uniref:dienelactone hydrolase family protein n=1 Tax=Georgenia sp. TF02-10 TaxID=2917725 RepID=UPI001FA6D988|nr:dienelactone hydrolase family protein [Georgenia sp. TF02-10]UNX55569.1 dienelactone hydrolase family protein [Georgenia sp. TF02-10]
MPSPTADNLPSPAATEVPTADGPMPAQLWRPPSGRGPGLVLVQEIFGVSAYMQARAADLAGLGYLVLLPDLYWRLGETVDESRPDVLEQGLGLMARLDFGAAVADTAAALAALRARPEVDGGAGLVGFCLGGGIAFAAAASAAPDVLVSYYGSALPDLLDLAPAVTAPSLHHFGTADDYLPMEQVERIRQAVERPGVEVHLHPGAGHAFDNPSPAFHHAEASAAAWAQTVEFLRRELPAA